VMLMTQKGEALSAIPVFESRRTKPGEEHHTVTITNSGRITIAEDENPFASGDSVGSVGSEAEEEGVKMATFGIGRSTSLASTPSGLTSISEVEVESTRESGETEQPEKEGPVTQEAEGEARHREWWTAVNLWGLFERLLAINGYSIANIACILYALHDVSCVGCLFIFYAIYCMMVTYDRKNDVMIGECGQGEGCSYRYPYPYP